MSWTRHTSSFLMNFYGIYSFPRFQETVNHSSPRHKSQIDVLGTPARIFHSSEGARNTQQQSILRVIFGYLRLSISGMFTATSVTSITRLHNLRKDEPNKDKVDDRVTRETNRFRMRTKPVCRHTHLPIS